MSAPPESGFWKHLFETAGKANFSGARMLLFLLAALATIGMALGVPPWAAIAMIIVTYNLEPIRSCLKHHLDRTKKISELGESRDRVRSNARELRRLRRIDEPELPLGVEAERNEEGHT